MSNRSSISVSNFIKVTLVTFLILMGVGIPLSVSRDSLERISGRSNLTPMFSYLDTNASPDARVIFLGSSRFVSFIKSDLFSQRLGIDQSKVLNLATDSGGPWEELLICKKYPSLFQSSPLIIIEVEPWMFNKNGIHPIYKIPWPFESHFYTWASFQERLEFPDLETKVFLLTDYFWPFSERRSLTAWISILHKIVTGEHVEPQLSIPIYHYSMKAYQSLANDPNFFPYQIAQDHLNNFEFAEIKAQYFKRLISLLERYSNNIILLQPPVRQQYMEVIYNNAEYLTTYMKVLEFMHSLENQNVHSIIWETSQDCGLDDSIFVDYGHFNIRGAYIFTQRLFDEMKKRGLIQ